MNQTFSGELKNPTLTLYGFHVRNTLDKGTHPVDNASEIWEQLAKLDELKDIKNYLLCYDHNQYNPQLEEQQETEYLPLLKTQNKTLKLIVSSPNSNLSIKGGFTPCRLHDTYAVDITLNCQETIQLNDLKQLYPKHYLNGYPAAFSLGSVFVFYAKTSLSKPDYLSLAQFCVENLFTANNALNTLKCIEETSISTYPTFIYDNGEIDPLKNHCVFVIFNPDHVDISEQLLEPLLYLFWFRQKILYAYHKSRECDQKARKIYAQIEEYVNNFNKTYQDKKRLDKFQEILSQVPQINIQFSTTLRDIEDHKNTLKSNFINLKIILRNLQKNSQIQADFLDKFTRQTDTYVKQIETDLSFLRPGENLLKQLTDNIRGIVAIDQVKQDEISAVNQKNIEFLIACLGFGLAISSISSAVIPNGGQKVFSVQLCNSVKDLNYQQVCLGALDFSFHLLVGIILAIPLTFIFLGLARFRRKE